MLRPSLKPAMRPVPRRLISTSRSSKSASPSAALGASCAAGAAVLALYGYSQHANALDLEAEPGKKNWQAGQAKVLKPEVFLCVLVPACFMDRADRVAASRWGRNSHGVASPSGSSTSNQVKRPTASAALSSLVLRDLALSATYGVAVDAKGDVLQWGQGFAGRQETGAVEKTLTGKDLIKVVPTEEGKVFGLSKKGEVWVWASEKRMQRAPSDVVDLPREVESAGWMWLLGKGTLWGRNANGSVETLKLKPDVPLARGEKCVPAIRPLARSVPDAHRSSRFTSLSAGASHLLALTSHGRSFAVPLCLLANQYGQLGVRSVSLLSPLHPGSSPAGALTVLLEPEDRLNELGWDKQPAQPKKIDPLLLPAVSPPSPNDPNPKGQVIPFLDIPVPSSSPAALVTRAEPARITLHPDPAQHAVLERSIHFCTTLHEIPSLRGVPVVELVAGKKHSLARLGGSAEGRVLGWGANSYGQLGASHSAFRHSRMSAVIDHVLTALGAQVSVRRFRTLSSRHRPRSRSSARPPTLAVRTVLHTWCARASPPAGMSATLSRRPRNGASTCLQCVADRIQHESLGIALTHCILAVRPGPVRRPRTRAVGACDESCSRQDGQRSARVCVPSLGLSQSRTLD